MKLNILIKQDEDARFVVEVPALPGCLSQSKTEEEKAIERFDAMRWNSTDVAPWGFHQHCRPMQAI